MKRTMLRLLLALPLLLIGAVVAAGCTEGDERAAEKTAKDAQQEAKDAWAELRTEGERLVDRVQRSNDAEAKQELLTRCRNVLERLRNVNDPNAGRVENYCDSIEATNPKDSTNWDTIRQRLRELLNQAGA